jgi:DNA polymerase III subunit alpha
MGVHSVYSFLDSTLTLDAIVALAQRHGLPAIALADTGNLHGAVEFTLAASLSFSTEGMKGVQVVGNQVRRLKGPSSPDSGHNELPG